MAEHEAILQPWHQYDASVDDWVPMESSNSDTATSNTATQAATSREFSLLTWNIDTSPQQAGPRVSGILSRIMSLKPAIDIILLQEVSREALPELLANPVIQKSWVSSECLDAKSWGGLIFGHPFASMILLSKKRFSMTPSTTTPSIGSVFRTNFPSRYGRDALCCDLMIPSTQSNTQKLLRIINVHLDSLAFQPSHRPQQLSIATSLLRSADCGLIAGDFNPVLPEDATLVQQNGLTDAWLSLRPQSPGYTWGTDGKAPFPPIRMDKIAMLGLEARMIEVVHPGVVPRWGRYDEVGEEEVRAASEAVGRCEAIDRERFMPWSDHSGIRCTFKIE